MSTGIDTNEADPCQPPYIPTTTGVYASNTKNPSTGALGKSNYVNSGNGISYVTSGNGISYVTTSSGTTSPWGNANTSQPQYYSTIGGGQNAQEGCLNLLDTGPKHINFTQSIFSTQSAVNLPMNIHYDYPVSYTNYHCFMEQDFTDLSVNTGNMCDVIKCHKRSTILAYDKRLSRLEVSSIISKMDPQANLEHLITDDFNINPDKTDYLSTLYSRYIPLVNTMITNSVMNGDIFYPNHTTITVESDIQSGLIPIVHLSNLVFGNLIPVSKKEVASLLENLSMEVLVLNKQEFPEVQKYYSPEYSYITFKKDINSKKIIRNATEYTKEGLISLLNILCVSGTNTIAFVDGLLAGMSLDQTILSTEDRAVSVIKTLIENAYN